jgi:predicted ABC-type ATPase
VSGEKKIVIIAGPNGAGKTTFALEFLPREAGCPDFINVDLIAAGLSPFDPQRVGLRAGRLMLAEIARRFRAGESFEEVYRGLVNSWVVYDNSGPTPRLVASGDNS